MNLKKIFAMLACVSMLVTLIGCSNEAERKADYLEKGNAYLEKNELEKARLEFKNVLQMDPKYAEAYFSLGNIEEREKNWKRAFSNYNKVLFLDPEHIGAREKLGRFYLLGNELGKSAEQVKEIYSRDPESLAAKNLNASIMFSKGDLEGAIKETKESFESDPTRWETAVYLSRLYLKKDDTENALAVLETLISKVPENTPARTEMAYIYTGKQEYEQAASMLRQVIEIDPGEIDNHLLLIAFYVRNDFMEKADAVIQSTIKKFPNDEKPYLLLVRYLLDNKQARRAVDELQVGIRKFPEAYNLRLKLVDVYKELKMTAEAMQECREIIDLDGVNQAGIKARSRLANILLVQGQADEALYLVEEALSESPNDYDALMLKGKWALIRNDFDTAINAFRSILKNEPSKSEVSVMLAEAHIRNGFPGLARDVLSKAIVWTSGHWEVALALLRTIERLEDKAIALDRLNSFFGDEPKRLEVLVYKAELQQELREEDSFIKTINAIKTRFPDHELGYNMLGRFYLTKGNIEKALEEFRHNNDQFSDSKDIVRNVVAAYVEQKKYDEGLAYIRNKVKNIDTSLFAQSLMVQVFMSKNDNAGAINKLNNMIDINPKWIKPYKSLVKLYMESNDKKSSINILNKGIKVSPLNGDFDFLLADFYEEVGDENKTIEVLRSIIKKHEVNQHALISRTRLALLLLKRGEIDEAKDLIRKVLVESPTNYSARSVKGRLALAEGDGQSAAKIFKSILFHKYNEAEIYPLLSQAYQLMGEMDLAMSTMKRGVDTNPNNFQAHLNYAVYLHNFDKNKKALEEVNSALKLSSENIGALKLQVAILGELRSIESLKRALLHFKRKYKDDSFGYYYMGETLLLEKRYEHAKEEFNEALRLSPQDVKPFSGLIKVYLGLKQYDKAELKIKNYIKKSPENPFFYNMLGKVYVAQNKFLEAEKIFRDAIKVKPEWSVSYEQIATLYVNRNDYKTAINWFNEGLDKADRKGSLYLKSADTYRLAGLLEEAKTRYQKVIDDYSNNIKLSNRAANSLATMLTESDNDELSVKKAIALSERFKDSNNPYFLDTYGWASLKGGNKAEAILALKKVVSMLPEDPLLQYHLGMAYYQNADLELAKMHLSNSLSSKATFPGRDHARSTLKKVKFFGR